MSVTDEPLLRRVQKLLALATSPNQHEAAAAASKAQALMLEHGIHEADLARLEDRAPRVGSATSRSYDRDGDWRDSLAATIAESLGGQAITNTYPTVGIQEHVIYAPGDAATAAVALFEHLVDALVRLAAIETAAPRDGRPMTLGRRSAFLHGAVLQIGLRIAARHRDATTTDTSQALVPVRDAVRESLEADHPDLETHEVGADAAQHLDAVTRGIEAGQDVPLADAQVDDHRRELGS